MLLIGIFIILINSDTRSFNLLYLSVSTPRNTGLTSLIIWHTPPVKEKQRNIVSLYQTLYPSSTYYSYYCMQKALGKRYPDKISNVNLYKTCKSKPISLEIVKQRWKLFGDQTQKLQYTKQCCITSDTFQRRASEVENVPVL